MKRLKKLLAGILTLAMAMSMMSMSVFASSIPSTTTQVPTIDTAKDVSLTIYKYRYDGDNPGTASGTKADLESGIPDDAQLLNDVTFKVYKVAELVQEKADGTSTYQLKYKTIDAVKTALGNNSVDYISGGMTANEIATLFTDDVLQALENNAAYKTDNISEKTTATVKIDGADTDGIAQFTSSDLNGQGLYLVVETDAPDVVTTKVDSFLVSLPMTSVDGDDWIYDVYAFPKNGTTTGEITLVKEGKTGNGTAVSVSAKFVLQKWMEVTEGSTTTEKWVTLAENDNGGKINGSTDAADDGSVITVTKENGVKISGLSQGYYRFVEVEAPDSEYIMDGEAYLFAMKDDGTLYALSIDTNGKFVVGTEITNAKITAINYKPEVEKEVLKNGGTPTNADDWQEAADYSVGDHVPFKVTSAVPENIDKLKHYALVDTMSAGLTMDAVDTASFKVTYYAGTTAVTSTGITATPEYNSTTNQWTLDLKGDVAKLAASSITSIEVTFTATLNASAVTAGSGNPNDIGLEYTNKLYPEGYTLPEGEPYEETKTITDEVVVYTFGIELIKQFTGGTASDKVNATFDLYRTAATGDTDTETIKVNGADKSVVKVGTYTTDANGKITINTDQTATNGDDNPDKAFSNGTYYFVETKTAEGYNLLKEPVPVEIELYYSQTFNTTTTVTKYNEDGAVISVAVTEYDPSGIEIKTTTTTYIDESGTTLTTPTVATTAGTGNANAAGTTYYTDANNQNTTTVTTTSITVVNNSGFDLPSTGGIGTAVFTFVGIAMMAAAVILFFTSRKKEEAK